MKLKKDYLSQTLSVDQQADLLLNYLKSTYLPKHYIQAQKDSKKGIETYEDASSQEKPSGSESQQEPLLQENLTLSVQASSSTSQEGTSNAREKLKHLLDEMAESRRKNELIYGFEEHTQEADKRWGVEASKMPGCYKRSLESTITGDKNGWVEFNITYDNKIYLSYPTIHVGNLQFSSNHIPIWGTFLKAAGQLKLDENGKLIIFPYSQCFESELDPDDYLSIMFFTFREKGFPISAENIIIVNEKGTPVPHIKIGASMKKEVDAISFYLDEAHFPSAKAIAECKNLPIESKLAALFLDIEISILNTQKYHVQKYHVQSVESKLSELKSRIVTFLLLLAEDILWQKQKTAESNEALDNYQHIISIIELFKIGGNGVGFILNELNILAYCLYRLGLQIESESQEENKAALTELESIKASLEKITETPIAVQSSVEYNKITASFIRFYTKNPVNTCIALLHDYTKGSFLRRFFSGAWRRHHIQPVNQFLKKYDAYEFADNLSVQNIYEELFRLENNLENHPGKRGTLLERLLFCAKLANELQNETSNVLTGTIETRNGPPIEEPVRDIAINAPNVALDEVDQVVTLERKSSVEKPIPSRKVGMFSPSSSSKYSVEEKDLSNDDIGSVESILSSPRSTP